MEVHYNNISYPYNTAGSFIEYFEGLTYEHVNFIFSGASHAQVREEIVVYSVEDILCFDLMVFSCFLNVDLLKTLVF